MYFKSLIIIENHCNVQKLLLFRRIKLSWHFNSTVLLFNGVTEWRKNTNYTVLEESSETRMRVILITGKRNLVTVEEAQLSSSKPQWDASYITLVKWSIWCISVTFLSLLILLNLSSCIQGIMLNTSPSFKHHNLERTWIKKPMKAI